jgi:uncharacterized protein
MLSDRFEISLYLDFYGDLLTNHQKEILDDYYNEDLSMNEIAENYEISKSAVQDLIKRSINQLENYEKALKLVEKNRKFEIILEDMRKENNAQVNKYIERLEEIK